MMDYNHWAAFGLLGEILPWEDNRVTLAQEKDRFGLPVAHISFNLHENDKKLIKFAKEKTMEVMAAAARSIVRSLYENTFRSGTDAYRPQYRMDSQRWIKKGT